MAKKLSSQDIYEDMFRSAAVARARQFTNITKRAKKQLSDKLPDKRKSAMDLWRKLFNEEMF